MPIAIWHLQLRCGSQGGEEEEEEDRRRKAVLKSNYPHLAGGETYERGAPAPPNIYPERQALEVHFFTYFE